MKVRKYQIHLICCDKVSKMSNKYSTFYYFLKVWDLAKPVVEEWTGMELRPASQYGIRIYTEGMFMLLFLFDHYFMLSIL
jgi:hypothetical protein